MKPTIMAYVYHTNLLSFLYFIISNLGRPQELHIYPLREQKKCFTILRIGSYIWQR